MYIYCIYTVLSGPEGPEPALGFFEKKLGLSHLGRLQQATKQQKLSPNKPGGRANVFSFLLLLRSLRFRLRYVPVPGV